MLGTFVTVSSLNFTTERLKKKELKIYGNIHIASHLPMQTLGNVATSLPVSSFSEE